MAAYNLTAQIHIFSGDEEMKARQPEVIETCFWRESCALGGKNHNFSFPSLSFTSYQVREICDLSNIMVICFFSWLLYGEIEWVWKRNRVYDKIGVNAYLAFTSLEIGVEILRNMKAFALLGFWHLNSKIGLLVYFLVCRA